MPDQDTKPGERLVNRFIRESNARRERRPNPLRDGGALPVRIVGDDRAPIVYDDSTDDFTGDAA